MEWCFPQRIFLGRYRQLWDCDVVCKDGKYYMYFPLKDQNDIFRIGVAVSDKPYGPFIPEANPMKGSYSIDPAVWDDGDGNYYIYFGGLWGGQLQRYRNNKALNLPFCRKERRRQSRRVLLV